ncbi:MAG: ABC transporter ATP-binding protein [Burkholderiales bacterium]|nr:ABC transporter ATP-binding protein [Burkholderiales bacterium]
MTPLLELRNVSKRFGGLTAVDAVSFSIEAGELVGLIGPNGAGKTTLFNIIAGVYRPSQGQLLHRGDAISMLDPARIAKRGIARTFQNIRLFQSLTVLEHLLVAQTCRGLGLLAELNPLVSGAERTRRKAAMELLELVGLENRHDEIAIHLPYGAQRRLEIARALATSPELLLLDEPAAGLNDTETVGLREMLDALRAQHYTILLVEHDMKLVMRVCSRILVLEFGKLIASGAPAEIQVNPEVINAYLGAEA